MNKRRIAPLLGTAALVCLLCVALLYARYIDWPSFGGASAVRAYLPEAFPVGDAHHYTYRGFMDTWELYRFTTSPEAVEFLAAGLNLQAVATVTEFPLIISRPPPYWWHPERLPQATLYRGAERAPDGHHYDLLYSAGSGIAYLIRFDG